MLQNGYLSGVRNTIITDEIFMIKITYKTIIIKLMTIIRAMLSGQSVNKIQTTLQMTGQAVTKNWCVKMNLSW